MTAKYAMNEDKRWRIEARPPKPVTAGKAKHTNNSTTKRRLAQKKARAARRRNRK